MVVVVASQGQLAAGISRAVDDFFVQAFIPQAGVEGLDVTILLRLAGIDVMLLDLVVIRPFQDGLAGELGAVVGDHASRFAVDPDQRIEFPRHSGPRDDGVGNQGKVLAAVVIDCQNAEFPAGDESVGQEVQGPPLIRAKWQRHRVSAVPRAFATTASAHRQALFPIDAVVDLSRFSAAPSARLSHFSFESDGAFPTQC